MPFLFFSPLGLVVFFGWAAFTFFHYRFCIQQEFLGVLAAGTRSGLPLHNAVLAFAADRPSARLNLVWNHVLLIFLLPGLNFFHQARRFRRKLLAVADALDQGALLTDALCARRGIASADTLLAAAVGEASGRLADALERVHELRTRHAQVWASLVVTLLYPAILVLIGSGITQFLHYFIVPQFESILNDFNLPMPAILELGLAAGEVLSDLAFLAVNLIGYAIALRFSSTLRWYTPGVASFYRTLVRARVLEMLALLIEVERPLPEAFAILASAPQGRASRSRLEKATRLAGDGRPLVECLRRAGLLPRNTGPLLQSAQRTGNLPAAMRELAEHLYRRLYRRQNRLVHVVAPLLVVAVGGLFAVVGAGFFLTLVAIVEHVGSVDWIHR